MRRLILLALGAAALAYVLSRLRGHPSEPSGDGGAPAGSAELERFVEASERLHAGE